MRRRYLKPRNSVTTLVCSFAWALVLCLELALSQTAMAASGSADNDQFITTIEPSSNRIIKLSDQGLSPIVLRLKRAGGSVFFLNDTKDSLVGLEIDYGEKLSFCASGKMTMGKDGKFRSRAPFAPRGFVTVCFPHPGKYPVKVYGMKTSPQGLSATVLVE